MSLGLSSSRVLRATSRNHGGHHHWGSPGAPWIKLKPQRFVPAHMRSSDLVVEHKVTSQNKNRLLHYLGKHVPHAQKSLWSPDTPVMQDRHLFMLSTIDIDAFKYWFGMRRALVDGASWNLLWRAGLLPPSFYSQSTTMPRPVCDKGELYKYYLRHRKSPKAIEREDYVNYENSMIRTPEERAADRPRAPWV